MLTREDSYLAVRSASRLQKLSFNKSREYFLCGDIDISTRFVSELTLAYINAKNCGGPRVPLIMVNVYMLTEYHLGLLWRGGVTVHEDS